MTEHLDPETLAELEAAEVRRGIPVVAVDVDEVLVVFVEHLSQWMETQGYEMHLTRYELEGSMFRKGSGDPLPFEACIALMSETDGTAEPRRWNNPCRCRPSTRSIWAPWACCSARPTAQSRALTTAACLP